jgi:hypothetical protein
MIVMLVLVCEFTLIIVENCFKKLIYYICLMKYIVQSTDFDTPLVDRLLQMRGIADSQDQFFNPTFRDYWLKPSLLSDFEVGVKRILEAVDRGEKIAIFGDYDVDGVTSSWLLYVFIRNILKHPHVTVRLPNRLED